MMANRTLAENVAQAKADFKGVKDALVAQVDYDLSGVPTSEYGNKVNDACTAMYDNGKDYGIYIGYENGKNDGINEGYTFGKADGIYEGIEQGRQDVISKSKYIEKTASGKVIRLDDVSEVAHKVVVKADTPTEVRVYGKNLFNNDTSLLKEVIYTNTSGTQSTRIGYELELPKGRYTFTTSKLNSTFDGYIYGLIKNKDGVRVGSFHLTEGTTLFSSLLVSLNDGDKLCVYNGVATSVANTASLFEKVNIQLSAYSTGGDFEEYHCETITATSDGVEIPSNCPTMTFLAENDITVDYYGSYSKREWWCNYLNNGKAQPSNMLFAGAGWDDTVFDPPVDINMNNSSSAFNSSKIEDLRGILQRNGVSLIFNDTNSAYTQHFSVFIQSRIKYIPYLKLPTTSSSYGWFYGCNYLVEVDGYECTEKHTFQTSSGANQTFYNCTDLVHIIFHGIIANDINMQWCKDLDLESVASLFNCLKNFDESDPDNAHTKTITLSAESWALLDTYVYENGWNDYVNAKDVVASVLGWNYA